MRIIFALLLVATLLSCGHNKGKTEIIPLGQYTELEDGNLREVFLITYPPTDSVSMRNLLDNYHEKNGRKPQFNTHDRIYIQKRNMTDIECAILDREKELPISSQDLRNEDFLANYYWYSSADNKEECQVIFYVDRW